MSATESSGERRRSGGGPALERLGRLERRGGIARAMANGWRALRPLSALERLFYYLGWALTLLTLFIAGSQVREDGGVGRILEGLRAGATGDLLLAAWALVLLGLCVRGWVSLKLRSAQQRPQEGPGM